MVIVHVPAVIDIRGSLTQHLVPIEKPWDEIKRVAMDLRDVIMKMKEAKE